jgi:extracellular elastinolytic metalloproteinase
VEASRSTRAAARLTIAVAAVLAFAALMPSSGLGVAEIEEIHTDLADFDVRSVEAPTAAQREQARELRAGVRWNRYGTPQSLFRRGGYLSKPLRVPTAVTAARTWLKAHRGLFRLRSLSGLRLDRETRIGGRGKIVIFRERVGGLQSFDGLVVAGLVRTKAGWRVVYISGSLAGNKRLAGAPRISAPEALVRAARNVGTRLSLVQLDVQGREDGWTLMETAKLDGLQSARLVAFPTRRGALPAYHTVVSSAAHAYMHVIDARTGRVLLRQSLVDHAADNPKWDVFPAYPQMTQINRFPWNYPSADTRDLWCWFPAPGCQLAVANPASPQEWDEDARTNTPTFTTTGNNAKSAENWFDPFFPGPTQYQPTSPTRDYVYPWTNVWFETRCDPANFVPGVGNDIDAATTNLFAMHNRMHDWSYHLGFTEARWNAQEFNFGRGTLENDSLLGMVQAGGVVGGAPTWSGRDNAFMRTRPDGMRSESGMFLWQPISGSFYAPCVDGDYDMAVIGHEYTHMIENRMIGKGVRRQGSHAGAMGESASDFTAVEYLNEYGFVPVSGEDPYSVGAYVTGDGDQAIRNYNMGWPSAGHFPQAGNDPFINPLNFGDVGYDLTGPQVHADGEIWSATNFGVRQLLLDRYPSRGLRHQRECADGERPAQDCPGNRRWIQLVFDAYLLSPVAPTFLDMRNAILAADMMRFGGANQDLLWLGFARRGFGQNAVTTSNADGDPIPDFESPLHQEGTIVFNAVSQETGAPVAADVFVGHYEARATPIADTDPATAGPNLDNVASFVTDAEFRGSLWRAYEFVANAEGYGHVRFRVNELRTGETRQVTIMFPTNHASRHQGAVASGDGTRHNDLIDDTEGTNWESDGAPVQGRTVLVDLAGGAQTFDVVKVSAHLFPGQNRFTALRAFEVYACTGPVSDLDCSRRIVKSQDDAFPSVNPRPRAPELILRTWQVPRTTATHVLFRVVDNQCTGQTSYQGEQDNDPVNFTDCRTGSPPLPPRNLTVRAAELQVLSNRPIVLGAEQDD